jgi:alkylated DNA nucleotide flippase Atl1
MIRGGSEGQMKGSHEGAGSGMRGRSAVYSPLSESAGLTDAARQDGMIVAASDTSASPHDRVDPGRRGAHAEEDTSEKPG